MLNKLNRHGQLCHHHPIIPLLRRISPTKAFPRTFTRSITHILANSLSSHLPHQYGSLHRIRSKRIRRIRCIRSTVNQHINNKCGHHNILAIPNHRIFSNSLNQD